MQVFIVMVESIYCGASHWDIDRVFSTLQAAEAYVTERKVSSRDSWYSDRPEYQIEVEKVHS